jgi:transposase
MIYVRPLTDDEETELKRMTRQEIGRLSQRAQMILLSGQRRTVPEIAVIFGSSRATVRFWIRQFEADGPAALYDDPRSGRPRKVTPQIDATLARMLGQDPQQVQASFLATFWTTAMLVLALSLHGPIQVCRTTVRNALQRLKLRWGRPRLAMPAKTVPEKARKQWLIAEAVITAGPDALVVYADESRVQTLPLLRAMWQWVGQQIEHPDARVEQCAGPLWGLGDPQWGLALSGAPEDAEGGLHRLSGGVADNLSEASDHGDRGQLQQPYRARRGGLGGDPSPPAAAFSAEVLFASQSRGADLAAHERPDCGQPPLWIDSAPARRGRPLLCANDPGTSAHLGRS